MANIANLHKYPNCKGCGFLSQCPIEVCLGWETALANEVRVQESIKVAKEAAQIR